ncbi:AbrB family transcriptional regulator [Irregularibacter muris]|uniref:AbrB family transcriptional regulator n=1 Tax=Irregularibacter muris TaxID=1796619 RepID=A0AAE3KZ87_9FIRM|nr:AbrB family transcriptional regulator [Irregularibacter muris]MCR1898830.1 AbrB family transcriptional regulator [Irregularibacter muris]
MEKLMLTLLAAGAGGLLGIKLKIPAGAMIGSMFAVALLNIFTDKGYIPGNFKLVAQMVIGGLIGLRFTKESFYELRELIFPTIILVIGLTTLCVITGYIVYRFTDLDLVTALFSTAPGGLADTTIIAEAYGADVKKVALMHLMRLITVITLLPLVIRYIIEHIPN